MSLPSANPASSRGYRRSVFLNCPYDRQFNDLFLVYIAAISSYGFVPRTTLEVEGGEQRLRRITALIRACSLSFHDLSRVELDASPPHTPRFNMPFEAGLAVMHSLSSARHTFFLFEADFKRLQHSLSDLGGADIYQHDGTSAGVLREVGNALLHARVRPTLAQLTVNFNRLASTIPRLLSESGSKTIYSPRMFDSLVLAAARISKISRTPLTSESWKP